MSIYPPTTPAVPYEQHLSQDMRWALTEGSKHFQQKSNVFETMRRIAARLDQLHIPYAVVGGMALFVHGYRRFTEDVDLLVTREGLRQIHEKFDGLGYLPVFPQSKNLRDTETGVKIEFLITGDFPGDGKPKPVAFPEPNADAINLDGIHFLNLPKIIELKLASGMTSPGRLRDLADVIELIKTLTLPNDFAQQLNPFVREKFAELWTSAQPDKSN